MSTPPETGDSGSPGPASLCDEEFFDDVLTGSARFQAAAASYYAQAHDRPAVHRDRAGTWLVRSAAVAEAVLRDERFSMNDRAERHSGALAAIADGWLELAAGERHRLRRRATFEVLYDSGLAAAAVAVVDRRLDRLAATAGPEADLVPALLRPLWLDLVQSWLGLPLRAFLPLVPDVGLVAGALRAAEPDPAAEPAAARLLDAVRDIAAAARAGNGRGAVAAFAGRTGDAAVEPHLLNLFVDAVPAVFAVGSCLAAVLAAPEVRAAAERPDALDKVVVELLRLDPVQQLIPRAATVPAVLDGRPLREGERVVVLVGPVNHDPARFAAPEKFRLDRPPGATFGLGPHACAGRGSTLAIVARAVAGFLDRFPDARPAGLPQWEVQNVIRQHRALPVVLRP